MTSNDHRDSQAPCRDGGGELEGRLAAEDAPPEGGGARRFALRASLEVFPAADGDVYLLSPGGADVAVRAPAPEDRGLLMALASGSVDVPPGSHVAERLGPLIEAGLVVAVPDPEPLDPSDAQRFARQLPYLAELRGPTASQRRLRGACAVVLGCGGLGTWALGALACLGVGRIVLVDDDTVEESNLNRQVLYRAADVGKHKAELAARWVGEFDPAISVRAVVRRVRAPSDLEDVLEDADVLIQAADWPPYELGRWVNAACLDARVPYLTAGQQPPILRIGPAYVPGLSACFECHERALRRAHPLYDEIVAHRRSTRAPATTLGPASGIVGSLLAMETLHLLCGSDPPATQGRALIVDMRTLETAWEAVERDDECPACSTLDPS